MFQVQLRGLQSDWIPVGKPHEHAGDARQHVVELQRQDTLTRSQFSYRVVEVENGRES